MASLVAELEKYGIEFENSDNNEINTFNGLNKTAIFKICITVSNAVLVLIVLFPVSLLFKFIFFSIT